MRDLGRAVRFFFFLSAWWIFFRLAGWTLLASVCSFLALSSSRRQCGSVSHHPSMHSTLRIALFLSFSAVASPLESLSPRGRCWMGSACASLRCFPSGSFRRTASPIFHPICFLLSQCVGVWVECCLPFLPCLILGFACWVGDHDAHNRMNRGNWGFLCLLSLVLLQEESIGESPINIEE